MGSHKKKHEKIKKRKRSHSSSSDSDGSDLDKRLNVERGKRKDEKRVEKERLKELETSEEKRARRLAKKLQKEEKRKQAESSIPESINYTNTNNPFNDLNLTQTFVWGKKLEKEGKSNYTIKEVERENRERIRRNLREMEELKRNRDARQAAREDLEVMERDADRKAHSEWTRKETQFQLQQAKVRSRLRIEQNRAKPIDFLARYIDFGDEEAESPEEEEAGLEEPSSYLNGLEADELEDLIEDIKVYVAVTGSKYSGWWRDMAEVAKDELARQIDRSRSSIHSAVHNDVSKIFKGKSVAELSRLEAEMRRKVSAGAAGTDVSYWSSLLSQLTVHMARQRIREEHDNKLQLKLKKIREEQMKEMEVDFGGVQEEGKKEESQRETTSNVKEEEHEGERKRKVFSLDALEEAGIEEEERENRWRRLGEDDLVEATLALYEKGGYSPSYARDDDAHPGILILPEADDQALLAQRRAKHRKPDSHAGIAPELLSIAREGMNADEHLFAGEHRLETQHKQLWSEKYRPRKPRYLNRVQTGFDWNKYNQTHYDMDNPPPKIVQGYKFNIFYNDLLDVTDTPSFTVTACDDSDFAIIRFHAGPPYEDIAFKIVNREWEVNHKFGYKSQFQNGVFQLWFSFKRYRYRR